MSGRTLVFINTRTDAGTPQPGRTYVVLDTSWTPEAGERADLIPVRPIVSDLLGRVNLFDEAIARLDEWAAAAGVAERLMVGGVSWWSHARSFIRLDLHEMLLWGHVLAELVPAGDYDRLEIPAARGFLVLAAESSTASPAPIVETYGPPAIRRSGRPNGRGLLRRDGIVGTIRRPVGRVLRRLGLRPDPTARMAYLNERLATLAAEPSAVLAIVRSLSFHVIGSDADARRTDPYVTPVLDALVEQGVSVISIGLALDFRVDEDWAAIQADDRLLPMSFVSRRSSLPDDDGATRAEIAARLAGIPAVRIDVEGYDLGPAVRSIVADLGNWFERQRHGMLWAERIMAELRPSAVFTGWEGARTMWLGAAHRLGIPTLAVQHGVIYPNNPDYYRALHAGLVRPEVTCVFGPYERRLLIEGGHYEPAAVVVTGSPRIDPDGALRPGSPDERADVRRELGVEDGDQLLLVSAARNPVGDEIHSVSMVARLLDGPLPGVHVVVKLHPEEKSGDHYIALLAGLAEAGGYPPLRVSTVRDIDLYRLLRSVDAHLGLYSTVLTDSVLTGTPNMIAVGQAYADIIGYVEARVAVPVRSVADVRAFMADPQPPSREDRARFLEQHYQRGDATALIASAITDLARPPAPAAAVVTVATEAADA